MLYWDKNACEPWITLHTAYWALWESHDEMGQPGPDGVTIDDYLALYNQISITMIQDKKPVMDPVMAVGEETIIIHPVQFEPHGKKTCCWSVRFIIV